MLGSILGSIIIGALAGFIASKLRKGRSLGLLLNIIIGLIGGVLGGFVLSILGFSDGGSFLARLAPSTLGAILLLAIADFFGGKR